MKKKKDNERYIDLSLIKDDDLDKTGSFTDLMSRAELKERERYILDERFIIRGVTLLETEKNGRFISMPSRRLRNEERSYRDVCHPLNQNVRNELTERVFAAYDEFIENESEE